MNRDLSNYRKSYDKEALLEQNIGDDPMVLFQTWFDEVDTKFKDGETNAMTISTIGLDGFPKSRVVLLKKFNSDGFVFYTNYESEKGRAILENPHVCLSFFWQKAERQVIIKGMVEKVPEDMSDAYFESRPRGSQLGALASHQSTVITDRETLQNHLDALEKSYEGKTIPRPDFWGGFIVKPIEFEFWQGRANRLHDRMRYTLTKASSWSIDRLSP